MKTELVTHNDESSGEEGAEDSLAEEHDEQENEAHQDEEEEQHSEEGEEDFEEVPAMRLKTEKQIMEVDKADDHDEDEDDDAYDDDEDVTDNDDNLLIKPLTVAPKNVAPSKMSKTQIPKDTAAKATRPSTQQMVNTAIKTLNDRTGSSVQAIRNYLVANYPHVDGEKIRVYIKKYVKTAVASGKLIQTKGIGATGSFKLPAKLEKSKEKSKPKQKKTEKKKKVKAKNQMKQQQKKEEDVGKKPAMETKKAAVKETKAKLAAKQPKSAADALPTAELKAKKTKAEPIKKADEVMATKEAIAAKKPSVDKLPNGKGAKAKLKPNLQRKSLTISISKQPPRPKTASKGKTIAALVPAGKSPVQASKKGAAKKVIAEATNEIRPEVAVAAAASKPSSKAKKK